MVSLVNRNPQFNPDDLVLTKKEVLGMLNDIEYRWKQNKKDNWKFIGALGMMKAGIHMTGEETIQAIWSEIVKGFNEIMMENSLAIAKGNGENWADAFEKIKKSRMRFSDGS